MCLFSTNIEAGTARNRILVPFIGTEGLEFVHICDTGNDDNGVPYLARILTKPYALKGMIYRFGVKAGVLLAKAITGAKINLSIIRDFGLETPCSVKDISFNATGRESEVIRILDDLAGSEMHVAQFEFTDPSVPGTRWELNQLGLIESDQGRN